MWGSLVAGLYHSPSGPAWSFECGHGYASGMVMAADQGSISWWTKGGLVPARCVLPCCYWPINQYHGGPRAALCLPDVSDHVAIGP